MKYTDVNSGGKNLATEIICVFSQRGERASGRWRQKFLFYIL
jgi:hypothetical protein